MGLLNNQLGYGNCLWIGYNASPTTCSQKCFWQFAFHQAFHVMTVVPNQANDMMDIGRLQGFEVSSLKLSFHWFHFFNLSKTFLSFYHLVGASWHKGNGNKSFWGRRLFPHTLSPYIWLLYLYTIPIHLEQQKPFVFIYFFLQLIHILFKHLLMKNTKNGQGVSIFKIETSFLSTPLWIFHFSEAILISFPLKCFKGTSICVIYPISLLFKILPLIFLVRNYPSHKYCV